ncbi:ubiquitin carboxyl-terminal hydrolase [Sorangium sp. So ce1099]|uniref:ubiquitin carboxyl-terminal hydrolase n=1 Tax=Sorangium sp. So ce1099 TaxID=3133331 RepID=UPI003F639C93
MTHSSLSPRCASCKESGQEAPKSISRDHFDAQDAKEVWHFCSLCDDVRVEIEHDLCRLCTKTTLGSGFSEEGISIETDDEVEPSEPEEDHRKRKVPRAREGRDGRRNLVNFFMPVGVRLGLVTWNVAHFGDGPLELRVSLARAFRETKDFHAKNSASSFARKFAAYLDEYERWEYFWQKCRCEGDSGAEAELAKATKRHRGEGRPEQRDEDDEPEQSDEATGKKLEEREEADDSDVPEQLSEALHRAWSAYDNGHWRSESQLRKLWADYFDSAFELHRAAFEQFQAEWGLLLKVESEAALHDEVIVDVVALVKATKALRAAAKMVVLPLLQLRVRANLANKVQEGAEVPEPKRSNKREAEAAEERREALEEARKALAKARGASRWGVGPTLTLVVAHDQMLHRVLVARHIVEMFRNNEWLDAILLQEVNKGVGTLVDYLEAHGIDCFPGFKMASRSGVGSQTEYYPLAVRRGGKIVDVQSLWAYYNESGEELDEQLIVNNLRESKDLSWSKGKGIYRPILGFDVRVVNGNNGDRVVRVGVVHTSPAGNEMSRPDVFAQVERPLRTLSRSYHPIVVGGDYYLAAEAVTTNLRSLSSFGQALAKQTKEKQLEAMRRALREAEDELKRARRELKKAPSEEDDDDLPSSSGKKRRLESGERAVKPNRRGERVPELERKIPIIKRAIESVESDTNLIQFIRNDPSVRISVEGKIGALGLDVAQPLAGTNWKSKAIVAHDRAQVADFFVYSGARSSPLFGKWSGARVGLVDPSGGLRVMDGWELMTAKYWRCVSDHFPVGIVLSMKANDPWIERYFVDGWSFSPWVPSRTAPIVRPPREVLGIINPGNTCYVNATLQLLARVDLAQRYVVGHGAPDEGLGTLAETVEGILKVRAAQGQSATYAGHGEHARYTTALTEGVRVELCALHAARGLGTQEDAGEALLAILDAFDHRTPGFEQHRQPDLARAVGQGSFAAVRPSQFHFILEVETKYELGEPGIWDPGDDLIEVTDEGVSKHLACEKMLLINLPEDPPEPEEASRDEKPVNEEDEEQPDGDPPPLDFSALLRDTWNVDYEPDEDTVRVRTSKAYHPSAWKRRETTTLKVAPDHWLVALNRFGWGEDGGSKKKRQVDVPVVFLGKPLRAFVVHIGDRATEGHYLAYVHVNDVWYRVDDERVHDGAAIDEAVKDAYLLYYE